MCEFDTEKRIKCDCVLRLNKSVCVCDFFFSLSQFSSSSESPHECLSRSLPLRVYDCKCLSGRRERGRRREREWVMRDGTQRGDRGKRERERSRSVMVVAVYRVSYLACGLHNFPSRPPLCRPLSSESATCSTGAFVSTRRWPRKLHVSPKVAQISRGGVCQTNKQTCKDAHYVSAAL